VVVEGGTISFRFVASPGNQVGGPGCLWISMAWRRRRRRFRKTDGVGNGEGIVKQRPSLLVTKKPMGWKFSSSNCFPGDWTKTAPSRIGLRMGVLALQRGEHIRFISYALFDKQEVSWVAQPLVQVVRRATCIIVVPFALLEATLCELTQNNSAKVFF